MTLNEYVDSIKDKSIAVVGAGVSNMPLIKLLRDGGCTVTVCDRRSLKEMGADGQALIAMGAELNLGEGYLDDLHHDIIFRTPGLMPFEPHLEAAKARGSLITSEMEVFLSLCPCKVIAITGSDGKTTTSSIIAELLRKAGYNVHLGGNIGHPLLCETPEIGEDDVAVLELSSFQLHSMKCHPDVAVITNLSPNHLDKHKDFQDYIDAKRAIYDCQDKCDRLVLNFDDEHTEYYASFARGTISYFSDKNDVPNGTVLKDGIICRMKDGISHALIPAKLIKLPGAHNVLNYLAAFTATEGMVSDEVCAFVAENFAGVEHRLEHVRELDGVLYINDSIGTSPTRTSAGLHAMRVKPIVIAGGYDKHIPFDSLGDELCLLAKEVFLTGDTAEKIKAAIVSSKHYKTHTIKVTVIDDFRDAVLAARASARQGDIVLLSPACAAFDRFKNFEERGRYFKKIVMELE